MENRSSDVMLSGVKGQRRVLRSLRKPNFRLEIHYVTRYWRTSHGTLFDQPPNYAFLQNYAKKVALARSDIGSSRTQIRVKDQCSIGLG